MSRTAVESDSLKTLGLVPQLLTEISDTMIETEWETPNEPLCVRVDELLRSHKREPLLSTTGSRALIEELAARSEALEEAIREIALEVQKVAALQKGISDPAEAGAGDRLLGTVGERRSLAL